MQLRYYTDNEGQVRIAITDPQPDVERLVRAIDATDEDRALVEKLMAMDQAWADQALEDRIAELERDGGLEIDRLNGELVRAGKRCADLVHERDRWKQRCSNACASSRRVASGCLAVGLVMGMLIGAWLS